MIEVSIREAKNRLTELARKVEEGETVVVTRNGKPVFDLVPHKRRKGDIDYQALEAFKEERGITKFFEYVPDDFDDPLPEDFLINPDCWPKDKDETAS